MARIEKVLQGSITHGAEPYMKSSDSSKVGITCMLCEDNNDWKGRLSIDIEMLKEVRVKPHLYFKRCRRLYIDLLLHLTLCVQFSMKSSPMCK